ncbi:MAG TPA: DNA polymerase III subunit delta' [Acidobacteriaceae bacterium]|nr:DNA polymerase III subunit delta' [Acidobacteriaceae bacterium]
MNFRSFIGNPETVRQLQESVGSNRLAHAILLTGPRGAGKYTLAIALAQTLNCTNLQTYNGLPDACDSCHNCTLIASSLDLETRIAEAVEAREDLREVDRKETRILVQTHPDVLVMPPDPPQNLVKVGQVRSLIQNIQRRPGEGRRKIYIFPKSIFMNEAANALLKVLEEPPEYAHLLLLTENPSDLLPTIRSRTGKMNLHAISGDQMESLLAERHPDWSVDRRSLVARLAEGAIGRALSFDPENYMASRKDALLLLRGAAAETDHSALFRMTESYRAGAEGQQKTQDLLRALFALLEDVMLLQAGQSMMVRNIDVLPELRSIAGNVSFEWIEQTARRIGDVDSGMRRNLLRSLSLDALASQMQQR